MSEPWPQVLRNPTNQYAPGLDFRQFWFQLGSAPCQAYKLYPVVRGAIDRNNRHWNMSKWLDALGIDDHTEMVDALHALCLNELCCFYGRLSRLAAQTPDEPSASTQR
jgi:hypothetical protein